MILQWSIVQQDTAPLPPEAALRQCVQDVQAKLRQSLDSNKNIIGELEHDVASLTVWLDDGGLNKLDETVARYYRAAAVGKLNATRNSAGRAIDVPAAQQALDDFDRVIATDKDIPSWGVNVSNAEYMAAGIARNQVQSDSLEFTYVAKCAEKGHAGCVNILARDHVTGEGGQQVDFIRALDLHNRVFDTGTKFRCAGAFSARSIANIVYFTGMRRPGDDELTWVQKSYGLSDQVELREKEKGACNGAQARIEEFLYRLSNGERSKDILSQAIERLNDDSTVDRAVIEYFSGSIKESEFEAAVETGKTVDSRCDGYFEGMWYAELMKRLPDAKKYYQRLSDIGRAHCDAELVYAKRFKF